MQHLYKNLSIWLIVALAVLLLFNFLNQGAPEYHTVSYNTFLEKVNGDFLSEITLTDNVATWKSSDGVMFRTVIPQQTAILDKLVQNNITTYVEKEAEPDWIVQTILQWVPFLALILVVFIFMRRNSASGGGGGPRAMAFGKSRAKLIDPEESKVTLDDVAGIEEAKDEVTEIIDFLKNPEVFAEAGARIPTGVLLYGEPGTGKTLLARAIAGEAGVPFFSISGSHFVEMYVGVGASVFVISLLKARKKRPALFSLTKSMPWVAIEAPVGQEVEMTNVNRP